MKTCLGDRGQRSCVQFDRMYRCHLLIVLNNELLLALAAKKNIMRNPHICGLSLMFSKDLPTSTKLDPRH